MDFEKEIKAAVRAAVMEEINGLSVRAVLREQIVEAGFTHEEIRKMICEVADSYFRSAMNGSVETAIKQIFQEKVEETISKEIKAVIGSFSGWNGKEKVKDALTKEMAVTISRGFNIGLSITPKETENKEGSL